MPEIVTSDLNNTVDHLFRREAGKMVAVLTRIFGFPNIEIAEDIVQDTMLTALETWKFKQIPPNPEAWLYHAAKNKAIDLIRRRKVTHNIENELSVLLKSEYTLAFTVHEMFSENEIKDSQLRMMFACCHPAISYEQQVALMLKTLCGLSVHEIASAFLTNEETIEKRLYRAKEKFRHDNLGLHYPPENELVQRLDAVLKTLYLLFNEGYNSSHPQKLIREDLCAEAMRLTLLLTKNPKMNLPEVNALLALMCYHVSRFDSRLDERGSIVLLKDQDRKRWSSDLVKRGNHFIKLSAAPERAHEFHYEAAIASIHANAPSYQETDWVQIVNLYTLLLQRTGNPLAALNRCIALAEARGFGKAIAELEKLRGLENNLHYNSALGEMYRRSGEFGKAKFFLLKALSLTASNAEKELIGLKLVQCN